MTAQRTSDYLTQAQRDLLARLREPNMVVFEEQRDKHRIGYVLTQICPEHPGYRWRPKCINKQTVFALLANGRLQKIRPWPGHAPEAYALAGEETR